MSEELTKAYKVTFFVQLFICFVAFVNLVLHVTSSHFSIAVFILGCVVLGFCATLALQSWKRWKDASRKVHHSK